MTTDFKTELDFAAGEAVFGMQMDRNQAVQFVLNNVGAKFKMNNKLAETAVDEVMVQYKGSLGG